MHRESAWSAIMYFSRSERAHTAQYRTLPRGRLYSHAKVFKGRCSGSGKIVALKFLTKERRSAAELASLEKEIEILRGLRHPNIVQLLDSFHTPTEICAVTEFAHGELFEMLEADGHFPEDVVRSVARQLVGALCYLHQRRIIHRDLKPQNVLVCANGTVKLCDFGFARSLSENTVALTSIKGTPLYMAPELLQEQPYNHTVGCCDRGDAPQEVVCFAAGRPPFFSKTMLGLIQAIAHGEVVFPETMSEAGRSLLEGLLRKDPRQRLNYPALLQHPFLNPHNKSQGEQVQLNCSGDVAKEGNSSGDEMEVVIQDWCNNGYDEQTFSRYHENQSFVAGIVLHVRELAEKMALDGTADFPSPLDPRLFDRCCELLAGSNLTHKGVAGIGSLLSCCAKPLLCSDAAIEACEDALSEAVWRSELGNLSDVSVLDARNCLVCCGMQLSKGLLLHQCEDQCFHLSCEQIEDFLRRLAEVFESPLVSNPTRQHIRTRIGEWKLLEPLNEGGSRSGSSSEFLSLLEAYLAMIPNSESATSIPLHWKLAGDVRLNTNGDSPILQDVIRCLGNQQARADLVSGLRSGHSAALQVAVSLSSGKVSHSAQLARELIPSLLDVRQRASQCKALCSAVSLIKASNTDGLEGLEASIQDCLLPRLCQEETTADVRAAAAFCIHSYLVKYPGCRPSSVKAESHQENATGNGQKLPNAFLHSTLNATVTAIRYVDHAERCDLDPLQQLRYLFACLMHCRSCRRWQTGPFCLLAVLCRFPELPVQKIYDAMRGSGTLVAARRHILRSAPLQPPFAENVVAIVDIFSSLHRYLATEHNTKTTEVNSEMVDALMQILLNSAESSSSERESLMLKICSLFHLYFHPPSDTETSTLRDAILKAMSEAKGVQILKAVVEALPAEQSDLPVYLLTQLLIFDCSNVTQLRDCGGFQDPFLSKLMCAPCSQFVLETWLCAMTHVLKSSPESCPDFQGSCIVTLLTGLLKHESASVRAKTCCCFGQLCRHSDLFYTDLERHVVPSLLLSCCRDMDCATRKFACYAIGNAVFHSDLLHDAFCEAVPLCVGLMQSELDDRTRANAASVLGSLIRHSDRLCPIICQAGAIPALLELVDEYTAREDESSGLKAGWTALFSLGSFCTYPVLREGILKHNIQALLSKIGCSRDPSVLKYGKRLCNKLEDI